MSHPRLKLVIALCLSVAVGVAVDRSREGPAEGLGLAFGVVLAGLALARWLPAVVSLSSPGRRLIVFLVVDFLVAGYVVSLSSAEEQESLSFVAAATGVLAAGAAVYWWLPRWQATRWPITIGDKDRVELEDKARATVAQLLGGLGLIATVVITLYSVNRARVAADRTLRTTERDQAAARFSRAIDQLAAKSGSRPATVVRLGAIYALEQYALQDAPRGDCVEGNRVGRMKLCGLARVRPPCSPPMSVATRPMTRVGQWWRLPRPHMTVAIFAHAATAPGLHVSPPTSLPL